jgi:hypothetical protein
LIVKNCVVSEIKNSFLFPIRKEHFEKLSQTNPSNDLVVNMGIITYPLFGGKQIDILYCNFEKWMHLFVSRKSVDCTTLYDFT